MSLAALQVYLCPKTAEKFARKTDKPTSINCLSSDSRIWRCGRDLSGSGTNHA